MLSCEAANLANEASSGNCVAKKLRAENEVFDVTNKPVEVRKFK
jgi:hypothetical protein